jgi:hypothetical protein
MNSLAQYKTTLAPLLIACVLASYGFLPKAQAVVPPPDGAYPNFTTAEGQNALKDLTTGAANTALGAFSLFANTTGSFNTGVGAAALDLNTGDQNTAVGVAALLLNTGTNNTGVGVDALGLNTTGEENAAVGAFALYNNTTGFENTATGFQALVANTTGSDNTATGTDALASNTTGSSNTAIGEGALYTSTTTGFNTAIGTDALFFNTGANNTAIGVGAGSAATTGNDNVYVGTNMSGVAGESNACYIASIFGQTSANGVPVLINSSNKLGTTTSSARFKRDIHDMAKASEALFALRPVAFRYKEEIDPPGTSQFGLVAEDVEKVNPDLIVRDKEGKPYSVRYDQVNAMLLNEFLKEHRKVQELESTLVRQEASAAKQQAAIAAQQKQIEVLTAGLQKVRAQLELNKPTQQTVLNSQ